MSLARAIFLVAAMTMGVCHAGTTPSAATPQTGQIVSTLSLCHQIARTLSLNEGQELLNYLSFEALFSRAEDALLLPPERRGLLQRDMEPAARTMFWFTRKQPTALTWEVAGFVRGEKEDRCGVVSAPEASVGMFLADFFLVGDGKDPRIADHRNYSVGARSSELLAEIISFADPARAGYLAPSRSAQLVFTRMMKARKANDPVEAEQAFRDLDPADQARPLMISSLITIREAIPEGDGSRRLSELLNGVTIGKPEYNLLAIDYHFNRGEFAQALEAIDKAEQEVGRHHFFDELRLNMNLQSNPTDPDFYVRAAKLLAADDLHTGGYDLLIQRQLVDNDFDGAVLTLDAMVGRLRAWPSLGALDGFRNGKQFVNSPQYKQWLQANRKRKKELEGKQ